MSMHLSYLTTNPTTFLEHGIRLQSAQRYRSGHSLLLQASSAKIKIQLSSKNHFMACISYDVKLACPSASSRSMWYCMPEAAVSRMAWWMSGAKLVGPDSFT